MLISTRLVFNPSPSIVLSAHNDIKSYLGFAFFGLLAHRGLSHRLDQNSFTRMRLEGGDSVLF
jgi:hypothetical protein